MRTRRAFLREAGLAAFALTLPNPLRQGPAALPHPGIQLYSVRDQMKTDAAGTLRRLGKIGYREIESAQSEKGNYYGLAPKEIKKILSDSGMRLRSGHTHIDANWEKSIEDAVAAGQEYIICSVLPSKGQTVDNYQKSAALFNQAGEQCRKAGLQFGYHNHDSEFAEVDGKVLYDVLLEAVDPALVHMELDLGWVISAGKDPLHYFDKYPGRFPLWHLKDMAKTEKKSTEFGKGKVDVPGLLKQADRSGMQYYFVEQEEYAVDAWQSMEFDFRYLADKGIS